jgi:hypothetical protein
MVDEIWFDDMMDIDREIEDIDYQDEDDLIWDLDEDD